MKSISLLHAEGLVATGVSNTVCPSCCFILGAFPLSDVSVMTDEERKRFLPAIRTFTSVLEKENIDQNEINDLISQSEALQELLPENWKALIDNGVQAGFGQSANLAKSAARVYSTLVE